LRKSENDALKAGL